MTHVKEVGPLQVLLCFLCRQACWGDRNGIPEVQDTRSAVCYYFLTDNTMALYGSPKSYQSHGQEEVVGIGIPDAVSRTVCCMAVASGPAGPVLAGPLFTRTRRKTSLLASISALRHGRESHQSAVLTFFMLSPVHASRNSIFRG